VVVAVFGCALLAAAAGAARPALAASPRPADTVWAEGWILDGFVDPASGEGRGVQIDLAPDGKPYAVWANRFIDTAPFDLVASRLEDGVWSPAQSLFPPTVNERLTPRLARAPDGTLWLAWYEIDDPLLAPATMMDLWAARFIDGAWEAPQLVSPRIRMGFDIDPRSPSFAPNFDVLAVGRDEAWIAFTRDALEGTSPPPRRLYAARFQGGTWNVPELVRAETDLVLKPTLVRGRTGEPVLFFGLGFSSSEFYEVRARSRNAGTWLEGPADRIAASDFAVRPDSAGLVRVITFESVSDSTYTYTLGRRVREFTWTAEGFQPGPIHLVDLVPPRETFGGWSALSLASTESCAPCPGRLTPRYRAFWVDNVRGVPRLRSLEIRRDGTTRDDSPGDAFEPGSAWPRGAYDPVLDRWYVAWTGPPGPGARRRARVSWTQEFAGDLALGVTQVAPDTVRIDLDCTGDTAPRTFRVHRLAWADSTVAPPDAVPAPPGAIELAASPLSGPCPWSLVDAIPPGRWFYYVELTPAGILPGACVRTADAVVLPGESEEPEEPEEPEKPERPEVELPPDPVATSALHAPYPQPSFGSAVVLRFDLARDAADVRLVIHDSRGRLVRRMGLGALDAGRYHESAAPRWDGRDDAGRVVPAGVYWSRLWVDGDAVGHGRRVVFAP